MFSFTLAEEFQDLVVVVARKFFNDLAIQNQQDGRHVASRKLGRFQLVPVANRKRRLTLEFVTPEGLRKLSGIASASPSGREVDDSLAALCEKGLQPCFVSNLDDGHVAGRVREGRVIDTRQVKSSQVTSSGDRVRGGHGVRAPAQARRGRAPPANVLVCNERN